MTCCDMVDAANKLSPDEDDFNKVVMENYEKIRTLVTALNKEGITSDKITYFKTSVDSISIEVEDVTKETEDNFETLIHNTQMELESLVDKFNVNTSFIDGEPNKLSVQITLDKREEEYY